MWNGAGSVSPAGRACDWTGPCHCESCVARRGEVVLRDTNELTQERAATISAILEANRIAAEFRLEVYRQMVAEYELQVAKRAAEARFQSEMFRMRFGA